MLIFVVKFALLFFILIIYWLSEVQVKDKKINFKINMNLLRDKFELPCELVTNLFSSKGL